MDKDEAEAGKGVRASDTGYLSLKLREHEHIVINGDMIIMARRGKGRQVQILIKASKSKYDIARGNTKRLDRQGTESAE